MTAEGPLVSSYGAGPWCREPGAEKLFPPCGCVGGVITDPALLATLDASALQAVTDAAMAACLQRCPGWPARRREGP